MNSNVVAVGNHSALLRIYRPLAVGILMDVAAAMLEYNKLEILVRHEKQHLELSIIL